MTAVNNLVGAVAAFAVTGLVAIAEADTNVIPGVQINVTIDGQLYQYDPAAQMAWGNPNGTFGFYGNGQSNAAEVGHSIGWDMLVNPDPFIIANLLYTNVSGLTQAVVVEVVLPIGMPMGSTLIGGSVSGSLTDANGDGATFTALGGGAYTALADGSVAASLLSGVTVNAGAYGSALIGPESFGTPIPSQPYGAINSTMAIRYEFSLTAGDSVALAGSFVAVPGPGAVALLGLAGVISRRRRR